MWNLSTEIQPNYDGGLMRAKHLKGGFRTVKTKSQRNAIPYLSRFMDITESTICFVEDESKLYRLISNPLGVTIDSDWEIIVLGGISTFTPVGTWDSNNTAPVLTDGGATSRNGEFYFVVNTPTPVNVTNPNLFFGVTTTVINGNMIVSVGSHWIAVANNTTWASLDKPSVITDYVNGIVQAHTHVTSQITDLNTYMNAFLRHTDVTNDTAAFATVLDAAIPDVGFLRHWYYTSAQIDDIISHLSGGGGIVTGGNAITVTGGNHVSVGGSLTSNVAIDGAFAVRWGDTTVPLSIFDVVAGNAGYTQFSKALLNLNVLDLTFTFASGTIAEVLLDSTGVHLTGGYGGGSPHTQIDLTGTLATFTDTRVTPLGLQYAADYSSGFTVRSLIDKGYVLGAKTFTGKQTFAQTTTTSPMNLVGFASDPSVPLEGELSYNLTSHLLKFYNGTGWISAGGFTNPMTTAGDLIQGTTAGAPVRLASVAAGGVLLTSGVGAANSWGTVSNGLTATASTFMLGGTLTIPTTIIGTTANTIKYQFDNLTTTLTNGAGSWLANTTAATSGVPIQNSPGLVFDTNTWRTLGGSNINGTFIEYTTGYGASGSFKWVLAHSRQGGAYTSLLEILADSNGAPSALNFKGNSMTLTNINNTFSYTISGGSIIANRNLFLPLLTGDDTFVTEAFAQTLTNKTINGSNNTITNVSLTSAVTGILPGANGGTGVANTGSTITLGGNLTTSGAFNTTFTVTGSNTITFPNASITVARTNAAQTFTGVQTFSSAPIVPTGAPLAGGTNASSQAYADAAVAAAPYWKTGADTSLTTAVTINAGGTITFSGGSTKDFNLTQGLGDFFRGVDLRASTTWFVGVNAKVNFSFSTTTAEFLDSRATPTGLSYNADYSVTYTTRSLVDQGYVLGAKTYTGAQTFKVGAAGAGLAPIYIPAGTNLTTTEAGALENNGTHLFFTFANGGTRFQLDQQISGLTGGTIPYATSSTTIGDSDITRQSAGAYNINSNTNSTVVALNLFNASTGATAATQMVIIAGAGTSSGFTQYSAAHATFPSTLVIQPALDVRFWMSVSRKFGISTLGTAPARLLHVEFDDAANSSVSYVQRLTHTTSGTATIGIGTGLEFEVENASAINKVGGTFELVSTNITNTTEAFDWVLKNMNAGAAAAETFRIASTGRASVGGIALPLSTFDINGSLGTKIRTITASATAAATDHTVLCDSTGGVVAVTLPTASGATGRIYIVKKIDASANNVTLATVDGGTKTITTRYAGFAVQSDGSLWYVIASF